VCVCVWGGGAGWPKPAGNGKALRVLEVAFISLSRRLPGYHIQTGHDRLLPNPYLNTTRNSFISFHSV
jgi:hypothetical protein